MASKIKLSNANGKIVTIENNDSNMSDVTLNGASITKKVDTIANMRDMNELPETVWCSGYHSKNDGAFGSHFYRLKGLKTTETDNGGTVIIVSVGGADYVYELQYSGAVNVKWFGATGIIDDKTSLYNALASGYKVIVDKETTVKLLSEVRYDGDIDLVVDGVIDGSDLLFVGSYVLNTEGSLEQLPDISIDATKGGSIITLSTAPNLEVGDVFFIYNPTDYSWSGFRSNYRAGEWCEVKEVSGLNVKLRNPLYDSYAYADVNLYKLASNTISIIGNGEIKGTLSEGLIRVGLSKNANINIKTLTHKNNSCLYLDRCYNVKWRVQDCNNIGDGGDDYGISISSCQNIYGKDSTVYSRRHAISTGANNEVGSFPCRNVLILNSTLKNDINSGTHCADFHGNTECSSYINCTIYGGVTWQGVDNTYENCRIYSALNHFVLYGAEILRGTFKLINCKLFVMGDPSDFSRGIIDIGGNNIAVSSNTIGDCNFIIEGCTLNGTLLSSITSFFIMKNRGCIQKINVKINDLECTINDIGQLLLTSLISGTASSDYIIIDNLAGVPTGKILHNSVSYNNFPHRLPELNGRQTVTPIITASTISTDIVFSYIYPRVPVVQVTKSNRGYNGNRVGVAFADPVSISGATLYLATDDGTKFAAAISNVLNWSASIKEV